MFLSSDHATTPEYMPVYNGCEWPSNTLCAGSADWTVDHRGYQHAHITQQHLEYPTESASKCPCVDTTAATFTVRLHNQRSLTSTVEHGLAPYDTTHSCRTRPNKPQQMPRPPSSCPGSKRHRSWPTPMMAQQLPRLPSRRLDCPAEPLATTSAPGPPTSSPSATTNLGGLC